MIVFSGRVNRSRKWTLWALCFIGAMSAAATSPLSAEIDLIVLIATGLSLAMVWQVAARRFDLFDPLNAFVLCWSVLFVVRPVAMLITGDFGFLGYDIRAGFSTMLTMALVGELGFFLGYVIFLGSKVGHRLPPGPREWSPNRAAAFSILLASLAGALFAAAVIRGGGLQVLFSLLQGRQLSNIPFFASSSAYLYYGIYLSVPAMLFLIATGTISKRSGLILWGLLLLALTLAVVLPSGTRSWILPALTAPLVFFYLHNDRRPGAVTTIALGFLLFVLGITLLGSVRTIEGRAIGLQALFSQSLTQLGAAWDQFVLGGDTEMASLLSLEAEYVPGRIPFQHGSATGEVLLQPIPRQIWQDKPRPGDELLTRQLLIDSGLSPAPRQFTPMANFYLDFGLIGVLAGMAGLGVLARTHYEYFTANKVNPAAQMFYAATFPFWFVLLRGSVSDTAGRLIFIIPPLIVGLVVARRIKQRATILAWPKADEGSVTPRSEGTRMSSQRTAALGKQGDF